MSEIVTDKHGTKRYKGNKVVRFLCDEYNDLNKLWRFYHSGLFSVDEMKEFYKLIGYSVSGHDSLFQIEDSE